MTISTRRATCRYDARMPLRQCSFGLVAAAVAVVSCGAGEAAIAPATTPVPARDVAITTGATLTNAAAPCPDPCRKTWCRGRLTPSNERALQERTKKAHHCYDTALAADGLLAGRLDLRIKIAADGTVCAVDVVRNEVSDAVGTCVAETLAAPEPLYPAKTDCVELDLPLKFRPTVQ